MVEIEPFWSAIPVPPGALEAALGIYTSVEEEAELKAQVLALAAEVSQFLLEAEGKRFPREMCALSLEGRVLAVRNIIPDLHPPYVTMAGDDNISVQGVVWLVAATEPVFRRGDDEFVFEQEEFEKRLLEFAPPASRA